MNTTTQDKTLSTADFAAAADQRERDARQNMPEQRDPGGSERETRETRREGMREEVRDEAAMHGARPDAGSSQEQLAPLFLPQIAQSFRSQWDEVQIGFVDDPNNAVRKADELVAQVMRNLAQTFAEERANMEGQLDRADTEHLRVALRRYRSFFQRLLSL